MSEPTQPPAQIAAAGEPAPLTPLQRAFLALQEAEGRVKALESAAREPIAVIGVGCRLPGDSDDAESYWRMMAEGRDAISEIPNDRWDADAFYDPDPETPGRIATRAGGFLREASASGFDAGFFSIAPREAQGMDPQQRLLLEVAWEALEHAGQAPDRLEGSATGVYVGVCSSDYAYLQLQAKDATLFDAHYTSGVAHSIASGRLSYLLGLQGPSITLDTACSSSLVAVHMASQALRAGECRMALAGGVNLILSPDLFIALSHSRMLAPDGRCKTFDAAADGFARGEGCGVVVLKRLGDAQADGDRILAAIRGSAVNQDGPSSGLTAPNGPAQEAVIREALARAGVAPREVGFVEAHGTGTQLGDPLEVQALGAVFGSGRDPGRPLMLGSVKTNIGHLEAAAGVAGIIKVVLALQKRTIPAHLHFRTPSPHIGWGDLPLRVSAEATPFETIDGRRIAGISSFGFSGTNAHIVLEEAPERPAAAAGPLRPAHLLALSARDEKALLTLAERYAATLDGRTDAELADICFTANAGRAHFPVRATVLAHSIDEMRSRLHTLAQGVEAEGVRTARVVRRDPPRTAFVFTGQGAQYAGMGRGLYDAAPVFRAALDRCAELLAPHLERPLLEVLFPAEGQEQHVDETAYTQPALFALEYALAELWRSWGITPSAVIGHSVGEYAAACVAGVLGLEDALRLIAQRGRLMQSLPPGGAMAAIAAPEERVARAVAPHSARLSIAAVNAPDQTVISGAAAEVEAVCREFTAGGVRCKALTVSHAFHSPLVESVLDAFEKEAAAVRFSPPRLRLVSNLTGRLAEANEVVRPAYWRRHVREAVRFGDGMKALAALQPDCVLELGPHPTLLVFAGPAFGEAAPTLVASMRKGRPDWEQMLEAAASLYLAGAELNWRGLDQGVERRIVDLPRYPFQRERYWFHARPDASTGAPRGRDTRHPLLGTRLRTAGKEAVFEARLTADAPRFVRDHRVQGHVVLPATAYLETLLAAAQDVLGVETVSVFDVTVQEAMLLADDGAARTVQVVCGEVRDQAVTAAVSSLAESAADSDPWVAHVTASLRRGLPPASAGPSLDEARTRCTQAVTPEDFYAGFRRRGLDFGEGFRPLRRLWRGESEALGEVALGAGSAQDAAAYRIHPALLDGCLQVLAAALPDESEDVLYLPIGIGRYALYRSPGTSCWGHVVAQAGGTESRRADIRVFDAQGALVAELREVQLKRVSRDALERLGERWLDDSLYEVRWNPVPVVEAAVASTPLATLVAAGQAQLDALRVSAGLDDYNVFLPRLEALCADYVVQAMQRLGFTPAAGQSVVEPALAERLRIAPRHRRLFGRLLAILAEEGYLSRHAHETRVTRVFPAVSPEADRARLLAELPVGAAELELTGRVAAELAEALRGEREPMQLLFPGGSLDTAERLYRDTPTARLYNGLMSEVLVAAARRPGDAGPLRILEIGAGTGGTTAHVLPRLPPEGVEYTFTDVGPLFVARARERFGSHPFMRFEVLDLERDPEAQGFAARSYDVVIASNVVHATADLRHTLGYVRRLLVPGGLLAMLEVTAPQRWFDLTVGLTEGWWAFTDTDLRADYATMPRARWLSLLAECGFGSAAALPEGSDHQGALALQSLLVARAAVGEAPAAPRDWLLFADEGSVASGLAARLRARGDRCTLVRVGAPFAATPDEAVIDPGSAAEYRRLLSELRATGRAISGCLHLWSLDAAAWEVMSSADLAAAQARGAVSATLLAQALVSEERPPRLFILTRGAQQATALDRPLNPAQAPVWGLNKTLVREHPELRSVCIDLDPGSGASGLDGVLAELDAPGTETEIALREGGRRVARLAHLRRAAAPTRPAAAYRLAPANRGALDELRLLPAERHAPGPGEVEIAVEATGLNFKDVLNVLGMYPGDPGPLGGECAGRITAVGPGVTHVRPGDDVLAVAAGSFASHVTARAELVQPRPAGVSVEEGAGFPIAFLTAEFCLGHLASLRAGERVLIHAAAGGVGMAAVRLAQRAGAEVFATAGSPAKREVLRSMGVAHVFDSRTAAFAAEVLTRTNGRGVDVVLNSLSGDLIDASFEALARGGRFVEMGKRGIKDQVWVDALARNVRYFVVDWGQTAAQDPGLVGGMMARLVDELRLGTLTSLPRHVFAIEDAERAFRFMAQARHTGKIVVRHGPPAPLAIRHDGTYVVTGGLSGLGPVVARWLAERGAGRLVLFGRRGVTPEGEPLLEELRARGTTVIAEAVDVTDEKALRTLLARVLSEGPPLRGVVHGAGLLDDAAILQQDAARFGHVFGPKVRGGWLLDTLTRSSPLDWFVSFSSLASVLGSPGQANHSAANAFLDQLARERTSRGLPGLSINWGAWTEVGAAAAGGVKDRLAAQGLGAVTPAQGLRALERLLGEGSAQAAVLPADWARYLEHAFSRSGKTAPPPFLSEVAGATRATASAADRSTRTADLREQLAAAPPGRRRTLVAAFVRERALRALGVDPGRDVDPRTPLGELGLDSLLAVELRNTLGTALARSLPATLLFDYPTIDTLTDFLLAEVLAVAGPEAAAEPESPAPASLVDSIEDLSDEEVDRQLAARAQGKGKP